jgi:hypothetical protein
MIVLNEYWKDYLMHQPETGMGYQIASVRLVDGRSFDNVMIVDGSIYEVDGSSEIPFSSVNDIDEIKVVSGLSPKGH